MANEKNNDKNLGQEGNQNWDDQNDQKRSGNAEPNPERMKDKKGSAFNEEQGTSAGRGNQREERQPEERKDMGTNQTGPGLG
ncbi:MAG TPA: hypothetical protein VJT83_09425 [Chitinophagaceae bacterium]|nr:hypothetical protein [Chitinophagaceae bacterium]